MILNLKKIISYLIILFTFFYINTSWASPPQKNIFAQLGTILNHIQTLKAQFIQSTYGNGFKAQNQTGSVILKNPNYIRWKIQSPQKQLYLVRKNTLYHTDYFLNQINIRPLSQKISSAPILLLRGKISQLQNQYHIAFKQTPHQIQYTLTPIYSKNLKYIKLIFHKSSQKNKPTILLLSDINILNTMGQHIQLRFSKIKVNIPISNSKFNVNYLKGFSVQRF